ncbi:hypothetical protein B0H67DRAFT_499240 [Lasiosphaeris hirsuta]|uniref:T6SS Phospholipase effector Tle1-like catalytic domain-containing protein n=1 Tax=Lasiosphaeris hirsuta TaxID=260670 RepID=A0AA39ZVS6_9PEZI|nr:hypothetical protein B0H67DRAFT_499240 [Lasiosphaeris hirsuta]
MSSGTDPLVSDSTQTAKLPSAPKRIIICCDGTWMDSLGKKSYEPPSNVTRISRGLCRTCCDGTHQIINYFAGVGTANTLDQFTGGAFGMGLDADIRNVYNFICTNYVDGDAIILIGFSRGAFTARSTADMIASVGLLTPEGLDRFYIIFNDYENIGDTTRDTDEYLVPGLSEYDNSHGQAKVEWENRRMMRYKQGLADMGYTRVNYQDGVTEIKIKALAVWDTVGSLGIPPAPLIGHCTWRFTNTQVSDKVENAFQALALDEPRYAFRPSLWERLPGSKTNLKQVWFPGTHANTGGGWYDQQLADITLAWMCDQLSTLGVEFNLPRMSNQFTSTLRFTAAHPFPFSPAARTLVPKFLRKPPAPLPWGVPAVFHHPFTAPKRDAAECDGRDKHPDLPPVAGDVRGDYQALWPFARPWALGQLRSPTSVLQTVAGQTVRRPGLFVRVDEATNQDTAEPLLGTNETVHSSVRVRLVCGGLGVDDREVWPCEALLKRLDGKEGGALWRLERGSAWSPADEEKIRRFRPRELTLPGGEYPEECMYPVGEEDHKWRWVYSKAVEGAGQSQVPQVTALAEEPLVGFWERYLLAVTAGEPDVWKFAQRGLPQVEPEAKVTKRSSVLSAFGK